jgi:hypothetical protein
MLPVFPQDNYRAWLRTVDNRVEVGQDGGALDTRRCSATRAGCQEGGLAILIDRICLAWYWLILAISC